MDRHFRPYQVIPGGPIWLTIVDEAGVEREVVGVVDAVPVVAAPSTVMRMRIVDAKFTPPLPAG